MHVGFLVGTRPEIIKLSPLIRTAYAEKKIAPFLVHSGQHYDAILSEKFFEELQLPKPDYNLEIGSGTHTEQLARALTGLEPILKEREPDVLVVHGDTNTTLAGALAGVKMGIPVAHVEAGLRSFDRSMPEEINRTLVDHSSDVLFAQSAVAEANLTHEGIDTARVFVTGNTIVEACVENAKLAKERAGPKVPKEFALATIHRAENTDNETRLRDILKGMGEAQGTFVLPLHPRTKAKLEEYGLAAPPNVQIIEPVGYLDFLALFQKAQFVLTDSGGIQEEAITLGVPCLTARDNTERPETVEVGANVLVCADAEKIATQCKELFEREDKRAEMKVIENPYGEGKASERIISVLLERYENQ